MPGVGGRQLTSRKEVVPGVSLVPLSSARRAQGTGLQRARLSPQGDPRILPQKYIINKMLSAVKRMPVLQQKSEKPVRGPCSSPVHHGRVVF